MSSHCLLLYSTLKTHNYAENALVCHVTMHPAYNMLLKYGYFAFLSQFAFQNVLIFAFER